ASDELLQLLFRTVDALERAVELSVTGRERELDVAALAAELDRAGSRVAPPPSHGRGTPAAPLPPSPAEVLPPTAPGRLVQVALRPDSPLKGGRPLVALRKAEALGTVNAVTPPVAELAALRRDPAIDDIAIHVSRLSTDLQAEIIQARMTPVWQVFDRFPRLVRDSARQFGKQVALRVEGKEIELDRAILDELGDPLMHLLRNAVSHGIEPPAERRRAGKKPEGEIVLSAVRERSSVMITIADDGRGIDRDRVLERAKREGLVDAHAEALSH